MAPYINIVPYVAPRHGVAVMMMKFGYAVGTGHAMAWRSVA